MAEYKIPGVSRKQGKVRDCYDFGDSLLLVSTDRISAFDWILPTPIPDKGKVLNQMAEFWFNMLGVPNHLLTTHVDTMPFPAGVDRSWFAGRSMLGKKCEVVPIECVVRGYLSGSGWKEYQANGTVCGVELPRGLRESDKLEQPIFTPSTKAVEGHDENISFTQMAELVGLDIAEELRDKSIRIFQKGAEYALSRGIIIADTKFEFGRLGSEILLIDEVLTPDSSRFWPVDLYEPGHAQPSYDKQFVRDWLQNDAEWDKNSPPPVLPEVIVQKTREKYIEAFIKLTGSPLKL
ncbi:MAG: phosphoribosylaminoimidazolesuccinocarboxamide synthase [Planctomycetaceae bacterium]|jgi:phosphoribosylaminoimidazole-succinocarboxamide synthase|nr:phosphoribosylaminoimidazolesuccinocarboxamide synthase [Planctomycetaceae bacterium]